MKNLLAVLVLLLIVTESNGQLNRYVVRLKHKGATIFTLNNPSPYLSARAISRRQRYIIPIDSTDLPIPATYIAQIQGIPNVTILNASRWLNAIAIRTTDPNAILAIDALPFVQSTTGIASRTGGISNKWNEEERPFTGSPTARMQHEDGYFDYGSGASLREILLHHGDFLHNIGLRGQGMQIAMLDGGFFEYDTQDALDSAFANGQFLSTWDFVNNETSVTEDSQHGLACLSTIGANIPGLFIGTAPKSNFHLFKTEDNTSEYPIEEFNWACGAERADSSGADVISSSVGYGYDFNPPVPDYPYSIMNGNTTMAAIAADLAAKKGMIVVQSAGNSGNDHWRMITTPADADSILVVGAVNAIDSSVGNFSSYGPSADGQVKPDVASAGVGAVIQVGSINAVGLGNGTSYATPKIAGLATCLWQGFPEVNNMRIIQVLRESSHQYNNPNDRIGYGIPDMKKALGILIGSYASATSSENDCDGTIGWRSKDVASMRYEIEKMGPHENFFTPFATINAQPGDMLTNHNYEYNFSFVNAAAGTYNYNIYQVIDTNAATFARVYLRQAQIVLTDPCNTEDLVAVIPNPPTSHPAKLIVQSRFEISMMRIMIYDMKGALVFQQTGSKPAGRTLIDLPSNKWAKGKYIIKVYDRNKTLGTTNMMKL